jgi:DNA-binding transcriptional ArsR family regulator
MAGEPKPDDFNAARAELFEALGHPIRIQILQALSEGPLSFSKLKSAVGIESSGHLSFHLGKLSPLVRVDTEGNYALTEDGREALRLTSVAMQSNPEGKPTIKPVKAVKGQEVRSRWLIVTLIVGLLLGSAVAVTYEQSSTTAKSSTSSSAATGLLAPSECSVPSTAVGNTTYVTGTADYPPILLGSIYDALNGRLSTFDTNVAQILSPTYFNGTSLTFDFRFQKNGYFDPYMYGGNFNSSQTWLEYPTEVRMGTQGGLLFVYVQVLYLFGSPYGNKSDGGDVGLVPFFHYGNSTIGILSHTDLGTGVATPLGSNLSPDGLYQEEDYGTGGGANSSYYIGPATFNNPENGSFASKSTALSGSFVSEYNDILGTYDKPLLTRYLYVLNMSQIPQLTAVRPASCPELGMMFSLQTDTPFPVTQSNGLFDLRTLIDNFPTHDLYAPMNPGSYLHVYVKAPFPLSGRILTSHSIVVLNDFHFVDNGTCPTSVIYKCPIGNFQAPYPGYVSISGNSTLNFGVGVGYSNTEAFVSVYPTGAVLTVPAGSISVIATESQETGPYSANITVVYYYWTE